MKPGPAERTPFVAGPCRAKRAARLRAGILVSLAAVLFLPCVWNRGLWSPDEPKYAESTREMIASGNFILPHLNGDVYSEKPPLYFWLSAAAEAIPGVPDGSGGRLVSALAACATMLLTWRIGAIVMGEATGALAAVLLATSAMFWQLSQSGVIDPLLTSLCTAALYGFVRHRCRRRGGMLIFYGACALGVLAKGPVALLIPALAALTYTALSDGPRALLARHPLWGLPLVAAPALLWLAAATSVGGTEYAETMLVRQNVGRAFNAFIHKEPLHYFVLVFPVSFLPWIVFLPQAIVASIKEKIAAVRPMLFPLAWFGSAFVLFSVISSKKSRYMLPLCPAAALLVAGWLMRRFLDRDGRIARGRLVMAATALAGIALGVALALPAFMGLEAIPSSLVAPLRGTGGEAALRSVEAALSWPSALRFAVPALLFAAACAVAAVLALRRRGEAIAALLAGWIFLLAAAGMLWTPVIDPIKSAAYLAREIEQVSPDARLYYLRSIHAGSLNFYLRRDRIPVVNSASEIRSAASEPGAMIVGTLESFDRVRAQEKADLDLKLCRRVGEDVLCLAAGKSALGS